MIEIPSHQSIAEQSLAWVLEPTPSDKKMNCGKLSQVTVFTNGFISVKGFYCHRYDCLKCGVDRKKEILDTIIQRSPLWYTISVSNKDYSAITKRILRAGEKYCAVGNGDNILILTLKPVIEGSHLCALGKLSALINEHLDCEYAYSAHRFKHSNGLFPAKKKLPSIMHIKKKYAVARPVKLMVKDLVNAGYYADSNHHKGEEYFLRPLFTYPTKTVEGYLAENFGSILWAESPSKLSTEVGVMEGV